MLTKIRSKAMVEDWVLHNGSKYRKGDLLRMMEEENVFSSSASIIVSLLLHAVDHSDKEIAERVKRYVERVRNPTNATYTQAPASQQNMPYSIDNNQQIRHIYSTLGHEEKVKRLKRSMFFLLEYHKDLFDSQSCWIAVYHVIKDRLDGKLKKSSFYEYAKEIVPDNMPKSKTIAKHTMSNYTRVMGTREKDEAYYEMTDNPYEDLCNTFWDIIRKQFDELLTKKQNI